jgi:hypothetical protein
MQWKLNYINYNTMHKFLVPRMIVPISEVSVPIA